MQQFFENLLAGFGVTDAIDILLVTFIVYEVLGFIWESRAEQLVKGLVVLLVVALASQYLHLFALHTLLKAVLEIGLIALVVVFQPELRRGLEKMGRRRVFRPSAVRLAEDRAREATRQIVTAVSHMAEEKTGALIVFWQSGSLSDIMKTGTAVDAQVSSQLIENIFYKGSPLHDGALVIRGDRILSAACILPLTERIELPDGMGTRHRAALGMTEVSDAVVLVVSEETGIISMAENGAIERELDEKALEQRLMRIFTGYDYNVESNALDTIAALRWKGGR